MVSWPMCGSVRFLFQASHKLLFQLCLCKGTAMKHLFSSRSKKLQAIVFINALILGLTGMVHAQSQNLKGESTQKPVVTEKKPANKHKATNEAKITGKKQTKQDPGKDIGNYKGAQPPQGGRLGQGPDHPQ